MVRSDRVSVTLVYQLVSERPLHEMSSFIKARTLCICGNIRRNDFLQVRV